MRRRLLNLAATMSLVLCVAVAGIWIWSYPATPGVVHERPGRTSVVAAYRGRLLFETVGQNDVSVWPGVGGRMRLVTPWSQVLYLDAPDALPAPVFGFQRYTKTSRAVRLTAVTIPFWSVVVLLLMAPAGSLVRGQRARRRSKRGLCVSCGYDLRASPGRCPECGAVAGGSGA